MSRTGPVGVGFIGTGMISNTYLENLSRFPDVDVIILGDLNVDLARSRAEQHGIRQCGTADDVLNHPDVEMVVNLTIPAVHAEVASKALAAGKHVWTEKPISVDRASGRDLLTQAEQAGLLVGVAPDTVLAAGDVLLVAAPTAALLDAAREALGAAAPGTMTADRRDLDYLRVCPSRRYDVVCFDPFFGEVLAGSAPFAPIRAFGDHGPLLPEALTEARRVARRRVLVKAVRWSDTLAALGITERCDSRTGKVVYGILPSS